MCTSNVSHYMYIIETTKEKQKT